MGMVILLTPRGGLGTPVFVDYTFSFNSSSVTGLASIQAGDLLIYSDRGYQKSEPTQVVPTGFTLIADTTASGDTRHTLSYKIATGSEASTAITGMNYNGGIKLLAVFRADIALSGVSVQDVASQGTTGNPAAQTVDSGSGTAPIIALGAFGAYDNSIAESMTGATFIEENDFADSGEESVLGYNIMTTPTDVTVDMPDEGSSNTLISCYLELS